MSQKRNVAAALAASQDDKKDIMDEPAVLKHTLQAIKVRLRTSRLDVASAQQRANQCSKEVTQQRRYAAQIDRTWMEMEEAIREMAKTHGIDIPMGSGTDAASTAASATAAASSTSAAAMPAPTPGTSSATTSALHPILSLFSSRCVELSGQTPAALLAAERSKHKSTDTDGDDAQMHDVESEEAMVDDEEEDDSTQSDRLEPQLQVALSKRREFVTNLVSTLLSRLSVPPSAAPSLAAAHSTIELKSQLRAANAEVTLLRASLLEAEKREQDASDKCREVQRRFERMKLQMENAPKAEEGEQTTKQEASAGNETITVKQEAGANGASDTALTSDPSIPDTRPLSPRTITKLDTAAASSTSSSSAPSITRAALQRFRAELNDFKQTCADRNAEIKRLREQLSNQQMELQRARLAALADDTAVRETPVCRRLQQLLRSTQEERAALAAEVESLRFKHANLEQQLEELQQYRESEMQGATQLFDAECARLQTQIVTLTNTNAQLQQQKDEMSVNLDNALLDFMRHLRTTLLPVLQNHVAEQKKRWAEADEAKAMQQQATNDAGQGEGVFKKYVIKLMRRWKEEKVQLETQVKSLQAELDSLRSSTAASSSSSSSSSSSPDVSSLRAQLASIEHERDTLKKEVEQLRESEIGAMSAELTTTQEMADAIGAELDVMSGQLQDSADGCARLTENVAESAKHVDKMRAEKTIWFKQRSTVMNQLATAKAAMETIENHNKQLKAKDAAQESQIAAYHEQTKKRDELIAAHQQALQQLRTTQQQLMHELSDAKAIAKRMNDQHAQCETHIKQWMEKEKEAVSSARSLRERCNLLAARVSAGGGGKAGGGSGDKSLIDKLRLLVTCQVCETNQKNQIITRCSHAFCDKCLTANIQSRNRKCPSCGLKFAESDVAPLYL